MNFESLARLDDRMGKYLCRGVLLTGPARERRRNAKLRVIVAKLRSIGDVVLALPMVRALKESGAEVIFVTGAVNRQWLTLQPYIDRVIAVELETLWRLPSFLRLLREIGRENADVYIDLTQSSHFAAAICHLSHAPMRIGFKMLDRRRRGKNRMYTHLIHFNNERHIVRNYFELLGPLGVSSPLSISLAPLQFAVADEEHVNSFLQDANPDGRELVGVHLSGMIPAKCWPLDLWAETIASVLSEKRLVIAVGSHSESSRIEEVRGRLGSRAGAMVNAAGHFTLPQLFALMKRFRFFMANDGGPMHIAATMGIPTLGLFGSETPVRYAPFNQASLSLYKGDGLGCSPCSRPYQGSRPTCRRPLCLERIASNEVLRALEAFGANAGKGPGGAWR